MKDTTGKGASSKVGGELEATKIAFWRLAQKNQQFGMLDVGIWNLHSTVVGIVVEKAAKRLDSCVVNVFMFYV